MEHRFVNREKELKALEEIFKSDKFEFAIIYGRRRVGKTELITKAIKPYRAVYYLAIEENNLNRFAEECERIVPQTRKLKRDYEILFDALKETVEIVVIDEFQNLIKEDPKILSLFQLIIDTQLSRSRLKLVVSGSSISIIKAKVLEYQSPLFGRRTASMQLQPMKFKHIRGFFPDADIKELVEIYGFAGGIPAYLKQVKLPFWDWLDQNLTDLKSLFRDEVDFLLRYEFDAPSTYRQILHAIANGNTKINEIKSFIGVERTDIGPYLRNLIEIGLIVRDVPVTLSENTRLGRYYLKDNFMKFWFRFIYPSLSAIEGGYFNIETIRSHYNEYLGFIFEDICIQYLIEHPVVPFTKIGRWWGKAGEIDIVAINSETSDILFGSCKWKENVNPTEILTELLEVSKNVDWKNTERKPVYALFAKSFQKTIAKYKGFNVYCFDLTDLSQ